MQRTEDITKSAATLMLEGLRKGTQHYVDFTWPGSDSVDFAMVVLSCSELQEAQAATQRRWEVLGLELNLYTSDDFYSELSTQCLAHAIRAVDDRSRRAFPKASDLRDLITPDERTILTSIYIENQQHANPDIGDVSPEVISMIEQALKKKDLAALTGFGSSTLAIYLLGTGSQSAD